MPFLHASISLSDVSSELFRQEIRQNEKAVSMWIMHSYMHQFFLFEVLFSVAEPSEV